MKTYLSLASIQAKAHKRQNRMTIFCIMLAVILITGVFTMADMEYRHETARMMENHGNWHVALKNITKEEAESIHHLSGPFSFVLESKGGIIFSSSLSSPVFSGSKARSTHGYMPYRGPKPPFIVSGKRGEKNKRYIGGRLIDEIPTILSIFNL